MSINISEETDALARLQGQSALPEKSAIDRGFLPNLSTEPGINLTLLQYWAAIRHHAWHIALFVAATLLCTTIIVLRIPKQYESTAVIRIDPSLTVNMVGNQAGNSNGVDMGAQLATDEKEIVSPAVVTPAILKAGIWKQPADSSSTEVPPSAVAKITRGLSVQQVKGTYLLNVSYRCTSPTQAAALANALAEQFIEHEYQTRNSALVSLSQYMRQQIEELGKRMKESQLALNDFERENNIVNPDNMTSLLTQQLSSLQQELGKEQSEQRSLEANLALAKEGNLDALLVSDRGSALVPLLQAKQQAEMEFASLASKYGPGNYLYQQQQRKLEQIRKAVREEQNHIMAQIEAQARAEALQVRLTAKELADVKSQLNNFNRKSVQFAILKHKSDTDKSIYDDLLERLDAADVAVGYHSTALRIIDPARPNPAPVSPRVKLTLLFALLLSGTLGVVGSVALSGMDRTLSDPRVISSTLGINLLGSLPQVQDERDLKSLMTPLELQEDGIRSPFAESMLRIRSTLLLGSSEGAVRALAVISSQPGEGKTVVAINVATALAALGKRTVLVDGDLRRPQLHRTLNLPNRLGLSSVLQDHACLNEVLLPGPTERLTVLPAGPASGHAREMIAGRVGTLVEELKTQFDIVVFDTPPILGFADGLNIATVVDTNLLVVRAGTTPREYVQLLIDHLHQVRAGLAGIILNGVTAGMSRQYYYFHDGDRSYYTSKNGDHDA